MEINKAKVEEFLDPSPFPSVKDVLGIDYLIQIC
jgi:hypothetical protein